MACEQLGFGSSGLIRQFGHGNRKVLVDNISCLGNESLLLNCTHKRIDSDISNCNHAGVICIGLVPGNYMCMPYSMCLIASINVNPCAEWLNYYMYQKESIEQMKSKKIRILYTSILI